MQDEINLLKEKVDYLEDGSRRLHGLYDQRGEKIQNLQNTLNTLEKDKNVLQNNLNSSKKRRLKTKELHRTEEVKN